MAMSSKSISFLVLLAVMITAVAAYMYIAATHPLIQPRLNDQETLPDCKGWHICVDSRGTGYTEFKPVPYVNTPEIAMNKIFAALHKANIDPDVVSFGDHYLYIGISSQWGTFPQDIEFYFDEESKFIHFRASSRLGFYDFNSNKRTIEKILANFS